MTKNIDLSAQELAAQKSNKKVIKSSWLRNFLAIDEQKFFINLAQTPTGILMMALVAMAATIPHLGFLYSASAILGAMLAVTFPKVRDLILFVTTWLIALFAIGLGDVDTLENIELVLQQENITNISPVVLSIGFLLIFFVLASAVLYQVRYFPKSFLAQHPMISVLSLEILLCGFGSFDLLHGASRVFLWSAIFVLTPYIWFLPYAINDQRGKNYPSYLLQMSTLRPFWSPTYLPFGKGATFLQKHLSKNATDLAVTQLKAIKLLIWANILFSFNYFLNWVFIEYLGIPIVPKVIDSFLMEKSLPLLTSWLAILLSTASYSLNIAFWIGIFVGIARLAGYRLPRGCWRPLESQNLMEYFNRFQYYFKELLVDFFFIPTFFKYFRNHPRLRMFFATFMAAGVGNGLWHFFRDIDLIATQGPINAFGTFASYIFYCIILATFVGISQVRVSMGIRPSSTKLGRIYSFIFVWSFVTCMHVFSVDSINHSLGDRLLFLQSLFGVN